MKETLPAFLDSAPCGILVLKVSGEIVLGNETFCSLMGCDIETLPGTQFGALLAPGGRVFLEMHLLPLLRLQGRAEEIYLTLRTYDGRDVPILLSAKLRSGEDSHRIDCVVQPMERRNRFEDYLLQARKMTESTNMFLEAQVAARTAEIRSLATDLSLTEQREREALARTLHDTVQQELYAIKFTLANARRGVEDEAILGRLTDAEELLTGVVKMTRELTTDLKPAVLDDPDFREILRWLTQTMETRHGLHIELTAPKRCPLPNESTRVLLFRLSRELLFNIIKHAGVSEACVTLSSDEEGIVLSVEDAGTGFDPTLAEPVEGGTGLGLTGIRKRLQLFGGHLDLDTEPGRGTRVTVRLPPT